MNAFYSYRLDIIAFIWSFESRLFHLHLNLLTQSFLQNDFIHLDRRYLQIHQYLMMSKKLRNHLIQLVLPLSHFYYFNLEVILILSFVIAPMILHRKSILDSLDLTTNECLLRHLYLGFKQILYHQILISLLQFHYH